MSGSWLPTLAAMAATAVGLVVLWPLRATGRRAPFLVMVVAVGVAGSALYYLVGTPEAATPTARTGEPASLRDGVVELQRALERDPQRADGWALLGRSQQALGNLPEANRAFARAVQLAPDEPELLVEAAQTRAQADPAKQFDDTGLQWLRHAQRLAPGSERAGWLIGIALRQRGQDAEAAATWEALLPRLDPGAATALREQIAIAREKAGLPAAATPPAATTAATALTVTVALDPEFAARARLRDDASIFVIARVPGGPPMRWPWKNTGWPTCRYGSRWTTPTARCPPSRCRRSRRWRCSRACPPPARPTGRRATSIRRRSACRCRIPSQCRC